MGGWDCDLAWRIGHGAATHELNQTIEPFCRAISAIGMIPLRGALAQVLAITDDLSGAWRRRVVPDSRNVASKYGPVLPPASP